jgi:uncharacterized protein YndB with AHSA1/START domain
MSRPKKSPVRTPAIRGFKITRIIDAPRPLVFAAWTMPMHLKQWSAPHGFTVPESKGDLRVGGKWRACMVSPQTGKLWLGGQYQQIVKNELLVFTHAWDEDDGSRGPETLVTVRFSDYGAKTRLVLEQTGFASAESAAGHEGGWSECLERLKEQFKQQRQNSAL